MYWPHESLDYYDDDYVANLHFNDIKNQTHDSADDYINKRYRREKY